MTMTSRPGELLAASHPVLDELAMVADELQVEVLHFPAGACIRRMLPA
jgi:hypothetical protein